MSTIPSQKTYLGRERQPPTDDREGVPALLCLFCVSGRSSTWTYTLDVYLGRGGVFFVGTAVFFA